MGLGFMERDGGDQSGTKRFWAREGARPCLCPPKVRPRLVSSRIMEITLFEKTPKQQKFELWNVRGDFRISCQEAEPLVVTSDSSLTPQTQKLSSSVGVCNPAQPTRTSVHQGPAPLISNLGSFDKLGIRGSLSCSRAWL